MKKFGVEMEIVGIRREKALRAIRAVGVDIREENYNHTDSTSHWKMYPTAVCGTDLRWFPRFWRERPDWSSFA